MWRCGPEDSTAKFLERRPRQGPTGQPEEGKVIGAGLAHIREETGPPSSEVFEAMIRAYLHDLRQKPVPAAN